jgi:hypothetical protein
MILVRAYKQLSTTLQATRAILSISWNPKVHYRIHNSLPLVSIPSQSNRIHTTPSYLSKISAHLSLGFPSGLFPYNLILISVNNTYVVDRLCGLVVGVLGYRSGGPGSIPGATSLDKREYGRRDRSR